MLELVIGSMDSARQEADRILSERKKSEVDDDDEMKKSQVNDDDEMKKSQVNDDEMKR